MFCRETMMVWTCLTQPSTMLTRNPVVNMKPMATVNNVFRNTLIDDTEDNDGISRLLCNVEIGCLSARQLRKDLEWYQTFTQGLMCPRDQNFMEFDEKIYWVQVEIYPLLSHSAHREI